MVAVDGGFVFARFRKERNGVVLLLVLLGAAGCLFLVGRVQKRLALLLSLQGGLMRERTRPIAESLDKDAGPLACTRLETSFRNRWDLIDCCVTVLFGKELL